MLNFGNLFCLGHFMQLSIVIYLTLLSATTGLHNEIMFNNLFCFFLASILVFLIICRLKYSYIPRIIFYYGFKGIVLISVAGISWIITENFCDKYIIMKYLYGHAIWHIAVSIGGYYISLIPIYLSKKNDYNSTLKLKYKYYIPYISD